jgi:hypothetical protein
LALLFFPSRAGGQAIFIFLLGKEVSVRGFIFDVETGLIREVQPVSQHAAV